MAEATLTESFCERCGTKYEFPAPTELNTLRKTRGLLSGLKNYIMSQDALGDAVGDALRSEEEQLASQQLEAFHEAFNFCIDCRQYTCVNCWNDAAGRCRSCVPMAGTDDLLERFEATFHAQHPELASQMAQTDVEHRMGVEHWPSSDLAAGNGHPSLEWPDVELARAAPHAEMPPEGEEFLHQVVEPDMEPVSEPIAEAEPTGAEAQEPEPMVAEEPEPEPMVAEEAEPEPEPVEISALIPYEEPATEIQPAAMAAEPEPPALTIVWDADAPFELEPVAEVAEPAPMVAEEVIPEPEPLPVPVAPELEVAAEAAPEPQVEPEAEPEVAPAFMAEVVEPEPAAAVEPQPAPAAEPPTQAPAPEAPAPPRPIRPISETILRVPRPAPVEQPARLAAEDETPEVAARRAKLDMLGLGDPGEGAVGESPKVLPYRSHAAGVHPGEAARIAALQGVPGFWEASAREVAAAMTNVGVQSCRDCGLSLSATARFCRRCGTPQTRSA